MHGGFGHEATVLGPLENLERSHSFHQVRDLPEPTNFILSKEKYRRVWGCGASAQPLSAAIQLCSATPDIVCGLRSNSYVPRNPLQLLTMKKHWFLCWTAIAD